MLGPRALFLALLTGGLLACTGPAPPAPGAFTAWGYVRLVPREGVAPGAGAYGDRRVRDAALVDYSEPGFAVVYASGSPPAATQVPLRIVGGAVRARLEPSRVALGANDRLVVTNSDSRPHTLSCPEAGVLEQLQPGESFDVAPPRPGSFSLYLLDGAGGQAQAFAAPGPFAVAGATGRYELTDLAPGHVTVHAWHPRFAPVSSQLDAGPGEIVRIDLEMGVQRGGAARESSRGDR
jgi:hypothetical protein